MSNEIMSTNEIYAIVQQSAFTIQGITNLLKTHEDRITKSELAIAEHADRITRFEENERIDSVDAKRIKRAIATRCDYLLGIKRRDGVVAKESIAKDKKYTKWFRRRAYVDCKSHSRMATEYKETKKRDLSEVMEYIETWQPEVAYEGLTGAKAYIHYLIDRRKV